MPSRSVSTVGGVGGLPRPTRTILGPFAETVLPESSAVWASAALAVPVLMVPPLSASAFAATVTLVPPESSSSTSVYLNTSAVPPLPEL